MAQREDKDQKHEVRSKDQRHLKGYTSETLEKDSVPYLFFAWVFFYFDVFVLNSEP